MKTIIFAALVFVSTIIGIIYGIIHDELTYTLCPEFYTKVRFEQLNITNSSPRIGVALVGIINTWLYSLIIGSVLATAGLFHSNNKKNIHYTLQSFAISVFCSFAFGMIGFILYRIFPEQEMDNFKLPDTIIDIRNFRAVQVIHNFSYMGGIIGMFVGIGWQFYKRKKDNSYFGRASDLA